MTISCNIEPPDIARFADHLKELHRLSTASYDSLSDALHDHLTTGRRLFGPSMEMIVREEGDATLSFSDERTLSPEESELLQMLARSLGRTIEQSRVNDRLTFQARHDALTALPNRVYFMELLETALASRDPLAVLFIDLDRFKQINDTLGHAIGDRLLQSVAGRLRRLLNPDDLTGRMGGDEFTVVLRHPLDVQSVIATSRTILAAIREPYCIDGHELSAHAA